MYQSGFHSHHGTKSTLAIISDHHTPKESILSPYFTWPSSKWHSDSALTHLLHLDFPTLHSSGSLPTSLASLHQPPLLVLPHQLDLLMWVTRAQFWVISPPSCLDLWSSYLYFHWVFTHLIPLLRQIFTQMPPSQSGNLNLHSLPSIHPTLSLFSIALNTILPTFSYYVCICWYIHMYICLYVFSYITYSVFSYFIVCFPQTKV